MSPTLQRLFDLIKEEFDRDGSIHFLALSAVEERHYEQAQSVLFKVRVALTFQEESGVNSYYNGTDIFISVTPTDIQFAHKDEWTDDPPIRKDSPIESALKQALSWKRNDLTCGMP